MKYIFFLFLGLSSLKAVACSCNYQEIEIDFENSKFVSYVKVTSVSANSETKSFYEELRGDYKILNIYKGSQISKPILVGSKSTSSASCNVKLEEGEYIIFAKDNLAILHECLPTLKLARYRSEYRDYALLLLDHLSKKSRGQLSSFKPKLGFREVTDVFKQHQGNIDNIFFKHPSNKHIVGRFSLSVNVYIDKSGRVTKVDMPEDFVNETVRVLIENYIKGIKFRESYENLETTYSISRFK